MFLRKLVRVAMVHLHVCVHQAQLLCHADHHAAQLTVHQRVIFFPEVEEVLHDVLLDVLLQKILAYQL